MWLFQEREAMITNTFLMGSVTLKYIRNHWPRWSMFIFVLNRMVFIILIMKLSHSKNIQTIQKCIHLFI